MPELSDEQIFAMNPHLRKAEIERLERASDALVQLEGSERHPTKFEISSPLGTPWSPGSRPKGQIQFWAFPRRR